MLNKFFRFLSLISIFGGPSSLKANHELNPDHIFSKSKAVYTHRATNAEVAHRNGVRGKPYSVAFIDGDFHPDYMKKYADLNLIHPYAYTHGTFIDPRVDWKKANSVPLHLQAQLQAFNTLELVKTSHHGDIVVDALYPVAPDTKILPLDLYLDSKWSGYDIVYSDDYFTEKLIRSLKHAIDAKVDVINLSQTLKRPSDKILPFIKEAISQGILVIISSGNDSEFAKPRFFDKTWDSLQNLFVKSKKRRIYDSVNGKGILFVGSVGYTPERAIEWISACTEIPDIALEKNFILAPGEDIESQDFKISGQFNTGTSFSAPVVAGLYLLLKEYSAKKGYHEFSRDDYISILHDSGRDINYQHLLNFKHLTFKVADYVRATQEADRRHQAYFQSSTLKPGTYEDYFKDFLPKMGDSCRAYNGFKKTDEEILAILFRGLPKGTYPDLETATKKFAELARNGRTYAKLFDPPSFISSSPMTYEDYFKEFLPKMGDACRAYNKFEKTDEEILALLFPGLPKGTYPDLETATKKFAELARNGRTYAKLFDPPSSF